MCEMILEHNIYNGLKHLVCFVGRGDAKNIYATRMER